MTKEEILEKACKKHGCFLSNYHPDMAIIDGHPDAALDAMEIYSKQIAIAFKEWQDEDLEGKIWENYDGHDTWYNPVNRNVISTTELFDVFFEQYKHK